MKKSVEPQFKLRLPTELKDQLEGSAEAGSRSLTSEIVRRLELSFVWEKSAPDLRRDFELMKQTILISQRSSSALHPSLESLCVW